MIGVAGRVLEHRRIYEFVNAGVPELFIMRRGSAEGEPKRAVQEMFAVTARTE